MTAQYEGRTTTVVAEAPSLPAILSGTFRVSQYDELGNAIDLARAEACLSAPTSRQRTPPRVRQSESIQIAQPPLRADLGPVSLALEGRELWGTPRASIYDLGAVALTLTLPLPKASTWATVADLFGAVQEPSQPLQACFQPALDEMEAIIRPAIERPGRSSLIEDYSVLILDRLAPGAHAEALAAHPLVRAALLGERRSLSPHASALVTEMSYYPEDLALLSWNGALVIEPDPLAAETVADLLEFANVELLLLRSYEADLEGELARLNERIPRARRAYRPLVGRYSVLRQQAQRLVIEVMELTERIDNALKVTDDVYWNRLDSAALTTLRVHVWREGVDHRLRLVRESYEILQNQADSDRGASLELIIILLILFEIVLALIGVW